MNLEQAKARRLKALSKCNADRLLVSPTAHASGLCLPTHNTAAAYIIEALGEGLTIEQFAAQTQWSKSRIMANLYKVAKKTGVGIQRRNERLHIVWPEGCNNIYSAEDDIVDCKIAG